MVLCRFLDVAHARVSRSVAGSQMNSVKLKIVDEPVSIDRIREGRICMRTTGILRPTWDRFVDDSVSYSGVVSKWERSEVYDGPWHAHVGFEALLCVLGEGVFLFGEQRIPYTSGSLLLFDGRVPHQVSMQ